jgi:hypothetical protein
MIRRLILSILCTLCSPLFGQTTSEALTFCTATSIDSNLRLEGADGFSVSLSDDTNSYHLYSIGDQDGYRWISPTQIVSMSGPLGSSACQNLDTESPANWGTCVSTNIGFFSKTVSSASGNSIWDAHPGQSNIDTQPSYSSSPVWPQTNGTWGVAGYSPILTRVALNTRFPSPPPTGNESLCHPNDPADLATEVSNSKAVQVPYSNLTTRWFMVFNGDIDRYDSNGFTPDENWRVYWAYSADGATWTIDSTMLFRSVEEQAVSHGNFCGGGLLVTDMAVDGSFFYVVLTEIAVDRQSDRAFLFRASVDSNPTSIPGYTGGWSVASYPLVGTYPTTDYTWKAVTLGSQLDLDAMDAVSMLPARDYPVPYQVKQASLGRIFDLSGDGNRYYFVTPDPNRAGSDLVELWGSDSLTHPFEFEGNLDTSSLAVGLNGWELGFTHYTNNFPASQGGTPRNRRANLDFWYEQNIGGGIQGAYFLEGLATSRRSISVSPRICLAASLTGSPLGCSPTWWTTPGKTGLQASVVGGVSPYTYLWTATGGATITGGATTGRVTYTAGSAGTTITLSLKESLPSSSCVNGPLAVTSTETVQVDFADVTGGAFHDDVDRLARNGVTAGCGGGDFCPSSNVQRNQMSVFLIKGKHGASYQPPAAQGLCSDVPRTDPFAPYIEEAMAEGIMPSCGGGPFNPLGVVTRGDMAEFLIVAQRSSTYQVPQAVGIFTDVPKTDQDAPWIEQLYREGITGGCSTNPLKYCPLSNNTRAQMAVFINKTFRLP